jgi:ABC transporter substrate binding protein
LDRQGALSPCWVILDAIDRLSRQANAPGDLANALARPGGNITGLSTQTADLTGKKIELLRELLPGLRRLATIANIGYAGSVAEIGEVQAAAGKLGLDVIVLGIRRAEDIASAFGSLKSGVQALHVFSNPPCRLHHSRCNAARGSRPSAAEVGRAGAEAESKTGIAAARWATGP